MQQWFEMLEYGIHKACNLSVSFFADVNVNLFMTHCGLDSLICSLLQVGSATVLHLKMCTNIYT